MITYQKYCYVLVELKLNLCYYQKMQAQPTTTSISWAKSTEAKIVNFIDDYLIRHSQGKVRQSTQKLLFSLYKKGSQQQKKNMFLLLNERISMVSKMGKSSQQFLKLIQMIFENTAPSEHQLEKSKIVKSLLSISQSVFENLWSNPQYSFYSFCANMVDFDGPFKPYLLEANGCLKCFGKVENEFEMKRQLDVIDEYKLHLTNIEFVLKRRYEIKDFKISIVNKNFRIQYKYVNILYLDGEGNKKPLGRYQKNEAIPLLSFTTSSIFLQFALELEEDFRSRRKGINCWICGRTDEENCRDCRGGIEFQGQFKVISADSNKLNLELSQGSKKLIDLRKALEGFYLSVKQKRQVRTFKQINVAEMDQTYRNLMQNMSVLAKTHKQSHSTKYTEDNGCFSCNYYQTYNIIIFLKQIITSRSFSFPQDEIIQLKIKLKIYMQKNQIQSIKHNIIDIIAMLYILLPSVDLEQEFKLTQENHQDTISVLSNMIILYKEIQHKENKNNQKLFNWEKIQQFIVNPNFTKSLTILESIKLFVSLVISWDHILFLKMTNLTPDKLANVERLTTQQIQPLRPLINFKLSDLYKEEINNYIKVFLKIIPMSLVPSSSLTIKNPQFLDYVTVKIPEIDIENVQKSIILYPNPVLKLNYFQILPFLVQKLKIDEGLQLIIEICKFRKVWNLNLQQTFFNFCQLLNTVPKEQQLLLCLEGYDKTEQFSFLEKIYHLLVPQRMKFLIRIDVPNQIDEGLEYPILPIRQIKSDDLEGDKIEDLITWIKNQFKRIDKDMYFNLIIENQIIENLSKPIEVVYKRLVEKEVKKQIGKTNYYFLRVLYGIQALYEGNQKSATIEVADEKLNECIECSSFLFQKMSPKSNKLGFDIFMRIISKLKKDELVKREMYFKILKTIFNNSAVKKKIVEEQYGQALINQTMKVLSFSNKKQIERSALLLDVCSKIIDEASESMMNLRKNAARKSSEMIDQNDVNYDSQKSVKHIFSLIKECEGISKKGIIENLIKLLPFCSKDEKNASKMIMDYLDIQKLVEGKYSSKMKQTCILFDTLEESYSSIKQLFTEYGLSEIILQKITNFTMTNNLPDNQKVLNNIQIIQINLAILKGLLKGNQNLQYQIYNRDLLKVFQHLSKTKIECKNSVTTYCFEICEYFQKKGKVVIKPIKDIFEAKAKSYKAESAQKKNNVFEEMKRKREQAKKKHLTNENQEQEIMCVKCKQGYKSRKEVMGLYIYSTQIQIIGLDSWWKEFKKLSSPSSISYFTIIHYECHREAQEVDRNSKVKIEEWEGAQIRNNEAKCNNWVPFKGPKTTDEQFDRVLVKYFEKNKSGNFWNTLNDLNGLLYRFSTQYNFGKEGHGSSYEYNIKLIPVFLAFTSHLMKKTDNIKLLKEGYVYLEQHKIRKPNLWRLFLVVCIFSIDYDSFKEIKDKLWKNIEQIYGDNDETINQKKPDLIFTVLCRKIFQIVHKNLNKGQFVHLEMDKYIPEHFTQIIKEFDKLCIFYRERLLKCQTSLEFKAMYDE